MSPLTTRWGHCSVGGRAELVSSASPSPPSPSTAESAMCQEILCCGPFLLQNSVHSAISPTGSPFFHMVPYIVWSGFILDFCGWLGIWARVHLGADVGGK